MSQKAFTIRATARLRELKTKCGVCMAHKPSDATEHPTIRDCVALWDTGATSTGITRQVAEELGLKAIRQAEVFHAGGKSTVNVYAVNIILPNKVGFVYITVTESNLTGCDVLIGMDVISQGDFSITNVEGKTVFSFRVPSTKEIDYVEVAKREHERSLNPKAHSNQTPKKKKRR